METRSDWLTRWLPMVALVAFLVVAATTEYTLAHDVMKLHWSIAAGVPVAIDCYVVAAFRSGRDVPAAMVIMAVSLAAATGSHMAEQTKVALPAWATVTVTGVMLLILVVVLWRVHVITEPAAVPEGPAPAGPVGPVVQVRTETITVTATRSVAYLPATYVRTIGSGPVQDPIGPGQIGSDRILPAAEAPIRSTARVDPIDPPIRSTPRSGSPDPARSGSAPWSRRSRIGSDDPARSDDAALLADFRRALAADPIPAVDAIRGHYRIAPARARALRDAIKDDRRQRAAGGVEGDLG